MYAIIATGGKQYKVAEGDIIRVEKLGVEAGETVTFDQVLAVNNEGLKVGADVANSSVTASVIENGKARKVVVYKYKRKTGYHKKNGHRQQFTKVKIEKIISFCASGTASSFCALLPRPFPKKPPDPIA